MRMESILYFLETVSSGSINKASQVLHINHQNLGKILSNVEQELGLQLLIRNHSGINLTKDGEFVYEKFKEIQLIITEIQNYASSKNKPLSIDLHFYLASGIYMKPIITNILNIKKVYPNVNVHVEDSHVSSILEKIYSESNAIGNILVDEKEINKLPPDIKVLANNTLNLVVYVPKQHPLVNCGKTISLRALSNEKAIIIYSSYDLEENALYNKIMKLFPLHNIQVIYNLSTYYELMKSREYLSFGLFSNSITGFEDADITKLLFDPNGDFKQMPVYENGEKIVLNAIWITRNDTADFIELKEFINCL